MTQEIRENKEKHKENVADDNCYKYDDELVEWYDDYKQGKTQKTDIK